MNQISEDIIVNQLNQLTSIVGGEIPAYVNATIVEVEEQFEYKFNDGTLVEMPFHYNYYPLIKDDFIDMMSTFSLTHTITDICYDSTFGTTTVIVDMKIYGVKTTDFTTNITPKVMELFYNLPINQYR